VHYDREVDAIGVLLPGTEDARVDTSEAYDDGRLVVDYDRHGMVIGLEILGVTKLPRP
jgi:uncharacterized protein YuzE